ncbi:MAG: mannonate dehydratase, partial [Undibacterium sp.]|nr:mannonate dehydratase [Opitutaceae bacterium]
MKLGLGLYRHMLNREHFQFARQAGATHIVAHLTDYFKGGAFNPRDNQPTGTESGWGRAGDPAQLWTTDELRSLRREVEAVGLTLEAVENFDPAHWHDILLDGPNRPKHIENVKQIIRSLGEAGIPIMGYNFSLAGVAGRVTGPYARGGAISVGMEGPCDTPIPLGMIWNMVYDPDAPAGNQPAITHEELWRRLKGFLDEVLPVAEAAGVEV